LLQSPPQTWFGQTESNTNDSANIQAMIEERSLAKQQKDFAKADAIRKQLLEQGIAIEDTAQGVRWKRV
jgi:cysteinyl-tRNA synthetase